MATARQSEPTGRLEAAFAGRCEPIRRRELERALAQLRAAGELTPRQERTVRELSVAVVDGVVPEPVR